jgi:hypothetical protein
MPFSPGLYRPQAVMWILILAVFVAAFLAITVLGRSRWSTLGQLESLLARLAASAVAAILCSGGAYMLAGQILFVAFGQSAANQEAGSADPVRTQGLVAMLVALGLAIAAVFRIEMYHRRMIGGPAATEENEWKLEEPGVINRR